MASPINKKTLLHLAQLARIELTPREEEGLRKDLQSILEHVEDIATLSVAETPPMTGGTAKRNALRADDERENSNQGRGVEDFRETVKEYLKVPSVFPFSHTPREKI